jgi:hypothetical protein
MIHLSPTGFWGQVFERARPLLKTRNNDEHTRIAYAYALRLLTQGGDPDVVLPAVLLHDIGWSKVPEDQQLSAMGPEATRPDLLELHEREGATMAREILVDMGHPPRAVKQIASIIAGHDSKAENDSLEESIVKDADKLYRFSSEGFRWILANLAPDRLELLEFLDAAVDRWFSTPLAKRMARQELEARRAETGSA